MNCPTCGVKARPYVGMSIEKLGSYECPNCNSRLWPPEPAAVSAAETASGGTQDEEQKSKRKAVKGPPADKSLKADDVETA